MTLFNNTSKVLPYTAADTGMHGVILPRSSKVFFESDIDSKIQKTKSHIDHLSNAQAHRNTHGGKRFRAKQISWRDQVDSYTKKLALLTSAKEVIVKLDKEEKPTLVQDLTKNSAGITSLVNKTMGINPPAAKSYTEGQSSYTSFFGRMRKVTVLHANY
jgi:hypothetical protein